MLLPGPNALDLYNLKFSLAKSNVLSLSTFKVCLTGHAVQHRELYPIYCDNFFLFFCFLGLYQQHMEVPRLGRGGIEQQRRIQAASATCTTHSSWKHRILNLLRPGIEPTTSWLLVGFVYAVPQWELLYCDNQYGNLKKNGCVYIYN